MEPPQLGTDWFKGTLIALLAISCSAILVSSPALAQYTANQFVTFATDTNGLTDVTIGTPYCPQYEANNTVCAVAPINGVGAVDVQGSTNFGAVQVGDQNPGQLSVEGSLNASYLAVNSNGSTTLSGVLNTSSTGIYGTANVSGTINTSSIAIYGTANISGGQLAQSYAENPFNVPGILVNGNLSISNNGSVSASQGSQGQYTSVILNGPTTISTASSLFVAGNGSSEPNNGLFVTNALAVSGSSVVTSPGIAIGPVSNGSTSGPVIVTVNGGSSLDANGVSVGGGTLILSEESSLLPSMPSSQFVLDVTPQGSVTVTGGSMIAGSTQGSRLWIQSGGTLTINDGSSFALNAPGILSNSIQGTATVTGAGSTFSSGGGALAVAAPSQNAPAASLTISETAGATVGSLTVGGGGPATVAVDGTGSSFTATNGVIADGASFNVTNGATANFNAGGLSIGNDLSAVGITPSTLGSVTVSGTGSTLNATNLSVGFAGGNLAINDGGAVIIGSPSSGLGAGGGLEIGNSGTVGFNITSNQSTPDITTTGTLELGGTIVVTQQGASGPSSSNISFIPLIDTSSINLGNGTSRLDLSAPVTSPSGYQDYSIDNLANGGAVSILVPQNLGLAPALQQQTISGSSVEVLGLGATLPTPLQLATASNDVYSGAAAPVTDGVSPSYTYLGDDCGLLGCALGGRAAAYISPDGTQIIVAIRGTNLTNGDNVAGALKDLFADSSFVTGTASSELQSEVAAAAAFLAKIESEYPSATITLTGHSLGGAIAQTLAEYSGLNAYTFNAPGAGSLYSQLIPDMSNSLSEYSGASITNYRIYGDQYDLYGKTLPGVTTITLPNIISDADIAHELSPPAIDEYDVELSHSISTVITQVSALESGSISPDPSVGPNVTTALLRSYIDPILESSTSTQVATIEKISFLAFIESLGTKLFDPTGGTDFLFTEDAGSPNFACVELPAIPDVDSYDLRYEIGSSWSNFQSLGAGQQMCFAPGTDGLEFDPLDSTGLNEVVTEPFLFEVTFDTTGIFSGTLVETIPNPTQPAEVPEPPTFPMLASALSVLIAVIVVSKMSKSCS